MPATSTGFDISFPQCAEALPASRSALASWESTTVLPSRSITASPANSSGPRARPTRRRASTPTPATRAPVTRWVGPRANRLPGVCSGANSVACSYDYGWNAAQQRVHQRRQRRERRRIEFAQRRRAGRPVVAGRRDGQRLGDHRIRSQQRHRGLRPGHARGHGRLLHQTGRLAPGHLLDLVDVVRDHGRLGLSLAARFPSGSPAFLPQRRRSGLRHGVFHSARASR